MHCKEIGLVPYVPHLNTDPIKNSDLTPAHVFETDKTEIKTIVKQTDHIT